MKYIQVTNTDIFSAMISSSSETSAIKTLLQSSLNVLCQFPNLMPKTDIKSSLLNCVDLQLIFGIRLYGKFLTWCQKLTGNLHSLGLWKLATQNAVLLILVFATVLLWLNAVKSPHLPTPSVKPFQNSGGCYGSKGGTNTLILYSSFQTNCSIFRCQQTLTYDAIVSRCVVMNCNDTVPKKPGMCDDVFHLYK